MVHVFRSGERYRALYFYMTGMVGQLPENNQELLYTMKSSYLPCNTI